MVDNAKNRKRRLVTAAIPPLFTIHLFQLANKVTALKEFHHENPTFAREYPSFRELERRDPEMTANYKDYVMEEMRRKKEDATSKQMAKYTKGFGVMRQKQERKEAKKKKSNMDRSRVGQRKLRELFSNVRI